MGLLTQLPLFGLPHTRRGSSCSCVMLICFLDVEGADDGRLADYRWRVSYCL